MQLRPAFVLTTCALGACSSEPRRPRAEDPPPSSASAAGAGSAVFAPQRQEARRKRQPKGPKPETKWLPLESRSMEGMRRLNPTDDKGRVIYVGQDDSCWVEEPREDPQPDGPARFAPWVNRVAVDCPISMDDAAWGACTQQTLHYSEKQDVCACYPRGGNPPPPPLVVPCPADTKQ